MSIRYTMAALLLLGIWVVYSLFTFPVINVYRYESTCGQFSDIEVPAKGRTLDVVQRAFMQHKAGCKRAGDTLYRTTARDWSNCFNWPDNLGNKRWSIPYRKAKGQ